MVFTVCISINVFHIFQIFHIYNFPDIINFYFFKLFLVLAVADLTTCISMIFSGLSKGSFWGKSGWLGLDTFVNLPVASVSSNLAVLATVCVTLDRLVLVSAWVDPGNIFPRDIAGLLFTLGYTVVIFRYIKLRQVSLICWWKNCQLALVKFIIKRSYSHRSIFALVNFVCRTFYVGIW